MKRYRILKVVNKGEERYKVQEYNDFKLFGFWTTMNTYRSCYGEGYDDPAIFNHLIPAELWLDNRLKINAERDVLSKINSVEVVKQVTI